MFSNRSLTAAFTTLAAVLFTSAAFGAASTVAPVSGAMTLKLAPAATTLLDRNGHFFTLSMSGIAVPAAAQDVASAKPNIVATDVTQGVRLEFAHGRNWDAFGDLFPAPVAMRPIYLSGTTSSASASFALSENVTFNVGRSDWGFGFADDQPSQFTLGLAERLGSDVRDIGTTSASLNWNFADWGAVAITASRSTGNASMLGIVPASIGGAGAADTTALGIAARVGFGEGWVTSVAYSGGVTQLDLSRNPLLGNSDSVTSQGFGVSLAKQGLFGADALGIAVSRPLQVYNGGINAALANSQARESDVELGYVTSFLDGTLALQANAAYQLNAAGNQGQSAVTGVARAKLKF